MKSIKWLCLAALLAVLLAGSWLAADWFWKNNLHAVVDDELYRSAQMSAPELAKTIGRLNIKSVINLRGENANHDWYQQELAVCREKAVAHFDVRLGAKRMPTPEQLTQLTEIFKNAPRPMLIHCKAGSDRTGFASVLYLITEHNMDSRQAIRSLSLRFGHFALFGYEEQDEFYDFYEKSKLPDFHDWMTQVYPDIYKVEKIENQWKD